MAYMRLGDLLVASGTITGQQLERALALQKETKQRLGDVLIQNGFITEAQLIDALRVQLGVDFVDLTAISIPVELAQYVPRNIAKKYCVVPVKLVRNSLYLAMSDPLDFVAQDEVKTASHDRHPQGRGAGHQPPVRQRGYGTGHRGDEARGRQQQRCHPRPNGAGHGGPSGVRPHHPLR